VNGNQRRRARIVARVHVLSVFAAAIVLVWAFFQRDWTAVIVAAAALLAASFVGSFCIPILAVAGTLSVWPAFAVCVVGAIAWLLERYWVPRGRQDPPDVGKLAGAIADLPDGVRAELTRASTDTGVIDTVLIVHRAVAANPVGWRGLAPETVGERVGDEGGLIPGTSWTFCAAESALIVGNLDKSPEDVTLSDLAAAAVMVPNSAAGKNPSLTEASMMAASLNAERVVRSMIRAAKQPGGELILYRVELDQGKHGVSSELELSQESWKALRETGNLPGPASRRPGDRSAARSTDPAVEAQVPTMPSRPSREAPMAPPAPSKPQSATQQADSRPSGEGESPGPPAVSPLQSSSQSALPPAVASRPPDAAVQRERPKPRQPKKSLPKRIRQVWPRSAVVLWWVVRPLCTIGAVVVCALEIADGGGSRPIVALVLVILIRPARSWWLGLVSALVCGWLVLPVGVLVALRSVAGTAALTVAGHGWGGRVQALVRLRREITETGDYDEGWGALEDDLMSADSLGSVDVIAEAWMAAWSTGRMRTIATATLVVVRGVLFGRWPSGPLVSFGAGFFRLYILEEMVNSILTALAVVATFASTWLILGDSGHHYPWFTVPGWIGSVFAALFARAIAKRGAAKTKGSSLVLWALASFVASGWRCGVYLGIAAAIGLIAQLSRTWFELGLLGPRFRSPLRPERLRSVRARERWLAAGWALRADRLVVARRIWTDIANDRRVHPATRSGAFAVLADMALDAGDVQRAIELSDKAAEQAGGVQRVSPAVSATIGVVSLAAGDTNRATEFLVNRGQKRSQRRNPRVEAARAELLALDADSSNSLKLLQRSSVGLLRRGKLDQLISTEVGVIARLHESTPGLQLEARLRSMLNFGFVDSDIDIDARRQLSRSLARGWLLLGRIEFENGEFEAAISSLRRAASDLFEPRDAVDHAVAQILLGSAAAQADPKNALVPLAAGLDELELLRGTLRAGENRSQLIGRHSATYEIAFNALLRIQHERPGAGQVAAQLVESLRRSALAGTLRQGGLDLPDDGRLLLEKIALLEGGNSSELEPGALDGLREQLGTVLSTTFASAYLPEPVEIGALLQRVGSAHVLSYRIHAASDTEVRGHVVWSRPAHEPTIAAFSIDAGPLLEILGLRHPRERVLAMHRMSLGDSGQHWRHLGECLIPAELLGVLSDTTTADPLHLVVVPDGILGVLPWAALHVPDGRFLAQAATLQYTPTLEFIEEPPQSALVATATGDVEQRGVLVYLDSAIAESEERLRILSLDGAVQASNMEEVRSGLDSRMFFGTYIAAHGDGLGLGQHVSFGHNARMSAASALMMRWPTWSVFAACLVGQIQFELGQEPLGIPISCLIGGADSVIGGVIEINDAVSGKIASEVARRQHAGIHGSEALRAAQLEYLGDPARPAPAVRWAGFACLARSLPDRCFG
jgi:hypothetical protein